MAAAAAPAPLPVPDPPSEDEEEEEEEEKQTPRTALLGSPGLRLKSDEEVGPGVPAGRLYPLRIEHPVHLGVAELLEDPKVKTCAICRQDEEEEESKDSWAVVYAPMPNICRHQFHLQCLLSMADSLKGVQWPRLECPLCRRGGSVGWTKHLAPEAATWLKTRVAGHHQRTTVVRVSINNNLTVPTSASAVGNGLILFTADVNSLSVSPEVALSLCVCDSIREDDRKLVSQPVTLTAAELQLGTHVSILKSVPAILRAQNSVDDIVALHPAYRIQTILWFCHEAELVAWTTPLSGTRGRTALHDWHADAVMRIRITGFELDTTIRQWNRVGQEHLKKKIWSVDTLLMRDPVLLEYKSAPGVLQAFPAGLASDKVAILVVDVTLTNCEERKFHGGQSSAVAYGIYIWQQATVPAFPIVLDLWPSATGQSLGSPKFRHCNTAQLCLEANGVIRLKAVRNGPNLSICKARYLGQPIIAKHSSPDQFGIWLMDILLSAPTNIQAFHAVAGPFHERYQHINEYTDILHRQLLRVADHLWSENSTRGYQAITGWCKIVTERFKPVAGFAKHNYQWFEEYLISLLVVGTLPTSLPANTKLSKLQTDRLLIALCTNNNRQIQIRTLTYALHHDLVDPCACVAGQHLFHRLVDIGDRGLLKTILGKPGLDPNAQDDDHRTVLDVAIDHFLRHLPTRRYQPLWTLMRWAKDEKILLASSVPETLEERLKPVYASVSL